jgi:hypothetical protein
MVPPRKVDRTAQKPKKTDHAEKSETAGEFHFLHKDAPLSSRRLDAAVEYEVDFICMPRAGHHGCWQSLRCERSGDCTKGQ